MTLSSQMARTDRMSGSWGGSSRRRSPGPALTYGLAAGGVLLLAVIAWTFSGPSTTAAADGSGSATPTPTGDAATPPTPPAAQLPAGTPLANDSRQPAPAPQPAPKQPAASLEMGASGPSSGPSTAKTGTVDIPTLPTSIPASTPSPRHTPTLVPTSELKPGPTGSPAAAGADAARPAGAQPASHPASQPNPAPGAAPTNPPANPAANPPAPAGPAPSVPADVQARLTAAERAMKENRLVDARQLLNGALLDPRTPESDREGLRRWMAQINDTLVFSPTIATGDPLVTTYTIAKGDGLEKIAARQGVATDWRFIQRVNRLSSPGRISIGQKLKLVRGPFHAVVHKGAFRMDIFAGEPSLASGSAPRGGVGGVEGADPGWIYIRSFPVGLGTEGSTPTGSFVVRPRSKLINPAWTNPRTSEKFAADDPKNPIGERWMGLEGIDDSTRALAAYGIHGTIEPQSIGREMSMGCVRMSDADVEIVYELLTEGVSVVRIVP